MQQMKNDGLVHQFRKLFNQYLKKLSHSDTLLEGSVKLTSMQLVGESITAISVHYDAFMKLENMHFCGKELSESAYELL